MHFFFFFRSEGGDKKTCTSIHNKDILRPSHAKRTGSRPSAFSIHKSEWYSQGDGEVVGALEGSGMADTPQSDDRVDVASWLTQIAAEAKGVIEDAAQKLAEVKMWAKTRSRRDLGSKGSWCTWWPERSIHLQVERPKRCMDRKMVNALECLEKVKAEWQMSATRLHNGVLPDSEECYE